MANLPPVRKIPASNLRRLFNTHRYWQRAQQGEFRQVVIRERSPASLRSHEPPGTRSQMVSYRDASGFEVALVHQYMRPDGSIGGSGRPDPKKLYVNGVIYTIDPNAR